MRPTHVYQPAFADPLEPLVTPGQPAIVTPPAPAPTDEDTSPVVRQEFGCFLRGYFEVVSGVLLDRDPDGRLAPATHRDAFDAEVGRALCDLVDRIAAGEPALPDDRTAAIRAALIGGNGTSLRDRLAALPTPTGDQDATPRMFTEDSIQLIAATLSEVSDALRRDI